MPYPERIAEAVRVLGPERVTFGSDGPGCNPRLEVAGVFSAVNVVPARSRQAVAAAMSPSPPVDLKRLSVRSRGTGK